MYIERLTEDSAFSYTCQCCGKCCKSDLDIFLNPLDVWNIRNILNVPTWELHGKYIRIETRFEYGSFPFCFIAMNQGHCPFLEGNLCSIHYARPAACRFFPVVHFFDQEGRSAFALSSDLPDCPGFLQEKQYLLAGWLAMNKYHDYEPYIEFMPELDRLLRDKFAGNPDEKLQNEIFETLYNFDNVLDFPYKEKFPESEKTGRKALKWIIGRVRKLLGE